jgi:hypothetical protein
VARQLGLTRVMLPPPLAVIDAARAFDQPLPDRCWETWLMAAELPAPAGMRHPVPTMVLGYQVVANSITRSLGSIASRELHLRLF